MRPPPSLLVFLTVAATCVVLGQRSAMSSPRSLMIDRPTAALLGANPQSTVQIAPPTAEELLGEISSETPLDQLFFTFSQDARRVAWKEKRGKKWVVVVDGQAQREYDQIAFFTFSPDGQRLVYAARMGTNWLCVLNGEEGPAFDSVDMPTFSPDSRHLAYGTKRGKMWVMILGGQPVGPEVEYSRQPFFRYSKFSPDGQRLAYPLYSSRKGLTVVLDGKEGPLFDKITGLVFSSGSRRLAYTGVRVKSGWKEKSLGTVVVETQEGQVFEGPPPWEASVLASSLLAKSVLFFEDARFLTSASIYLGDPRKLEVSPGGTGVSVPVFSPDGQRIAYAACRGAEDEVMMINGEPGPRFEAIRTLPVFSPDGEHVAYLAAERKKNAVEVVDGTKVRVVPFRESDNFAGQVTFSPDGRHLAYVLGDCGAQFIAGKTRQARRRVVLDGTEGKEYDVLSVSNLRFGPDGRHLAYAVAGADKAKSFVVLDGLEGKPYDGLYTDSMHFSGPAEIAYVAREGRRLYRVVQRIP